MGNMCFRLNNSDNIEILKENDLLKNKNTTQNNIINYIIVDNVYKNTIDKNNFTSIINNDFISIFDEQEGRYMINELFFMIDKHKLYNYSIDINCISIFKSCNHRKILLNHKKCIFIILDLLWQNNLKLSQRSNIFLLDFYHDDIVNLCKINTYCSYLINSYHDI